MDPTGPNILYIYHMPPQQVVHILKSREYKPTFPTIYGDILSNAACITGCPLCSNLQILSSLLHPFVLYTQRFIFVCITAQSNESTEFSLTWGSVGILFIVGAISTIFVRIGRSYHIKHRTRSNGREGVDVPPCCRI